MTNLQGKRRWWRLTPSQMHDFLVLFSSFSSMFLMGYVVGHLT